MDLRATADVDLVALETDGEVTVLLELTAPAADARAARPPVAIEVVVDRSGSMRGERLATARTALEALVARLDPADRFGVVAFDTHVEVVVPAGPVTDRDAIRRAIRGICARGQTNLGAGYLRGLREIRRAAGSAGGTVVLLSDGMANQGVVAPGPLERIAAEAAAGDVTTSTIGIGLGYSEVVLDAIARGGRGGAAFAEHAVDAATALAAEVDGLLTQTVQAARLLVRPAPGVELVTVWNDVPSRAVANRGVAVELGNLSAGERRKVLLTFAVAGRARLGRAALADLELRWTSTDDLASHSTTLPVHVTVVSPDRVARRGRRPEVTTARAWLGVQRAKRQAADAARRGDAATARTVFAAAAILLDDAIAAGGPAPAGEMRRERAVIDTLAAESSVDAPRASKRAYADARRKSAHHGRRPRHHEE